MIHYLDRHFFTLGYGSTSIPVTCCGKTRESVDCTMDPFLVDCRRCLEAALLLPKAEVAELLRRREEREAEK